MNNIPSRFVSLHNHTGFSPYDGLGYPNESFEYCLENGIDAHAITEHGNMNSYAHAQLWVEDYNKKNKTSPFKYLPGVEAYFHPDLQSWKRDKELAEEAKINKAAAKKIRAQQEKLGTKIIAIVDQNDETEEIETSNSLTIENEEDSKSTKHFNPVNRRHHLVLLPKNSAGLQKLFGLVSKSYLEGFYRFPRIDMDMIKSVKFDNDIIASGACIGGMSAWSVFRTLQNHEFSLLNQTMLDNASLMEECLTSLGNAHETMMSAFGPEGFYLELQFNKLPAQNLVNRVILEFAKRNGLNDRLLVTCDAHYARPELWKEREIYKKLGFMNYTTYSPDSLPQTRDDLKCELYPKNAGQVWDEYLKSKVDTSFYDDEIIKNAIERTHDVAHVVIEEVKPDRSIKLPQKLVPADSTPVKHLIALCKAGLKKRGLDDKPEYVDRLLEEISVIKKQKMAEYFITLAKIIELAREVVFVGPARGSGGGSLVNYVLYITDLDPIKWGLPFARFMNVHRIGIPDIDTDVSDRDKVLEVMRKEFGYNNVVPISNYNTTKLKSLTKDLSKFYGIPFEEVNKATATVEFEVRKAVTKHGDDKNLFVLQFDEAMKYSKSFREFIEKYPQIGASTKVLFKQNRSLGRHAGGVLVCDDLPSKMPLITSKGEPQTPWVEGVQFKHLEKVGNFVKYDILGLETLRLIERTIELILEKKEKLHNPSFKDVTKWFNEHLAIDKIDLADQQVYKYVYEEGRFPGIFQLTSKGAQRLFQTAKPTSITDIAALTSIYRPGPLAAHVDKLYLESKNEGKHYDWGDSRINELLKDTHELLIFQEQVMMLAEKVAGFPKDKCDEVRRAIMKRSISGGAAAKAKVDEMMNEFVDGAVKNGYDKKVAEDLYEKIAWFSGYSFNLSHATAYAIDSYWCAWLLTHYEEEWLCAYLEIMSSNPEDRAHAFGEVKGLGYEIVPIDINYATKGWTILPGKKFMPSFLSCKGIGTSAIDEIIENRPYENVETMLWNDDGKWRHSKFNKRGLEALIKAGAFESMDFIGEDKLFSSARHMHEVIIEHADEIKKSSKRDPFVGRSRFFELVEEMRSIEPWTKREQAENMIDVFGSIDVLSMVPTSFLDKFEEKDIKSIDLLEEGEKQIVWFVVLSAIEKKTKNGKRYLFIEAVGPSGKNINLRAWGWDGIRAFSEYAVCLAEVDRNDFGCSTMMFKIKDLT